MADDNNKGTGILGLGGTPISKSDDLETNDDLGSTRRRDEDDPLGHSGERLRDVRDDRLRDREDTTGTGATNRHSGATGIDMGAGGEGTDISGR
jgi:hypothetical protein